MGISPFGNCSTNPPNPDPSRWELLNVWEFDHAHILLVKYHDCTNYEGVKLMVFPGPYRYPEGKLDPHFRPDGGPVARFEPTDFGLSLAHGCAVGLSQAIQSEQESDR